MPEKTIVVEATPEEIEAKKKAAAEAKKKKEEQLKKEAEANKPKPLYYFDIKVETMLPATLTYRILAEDPIQAADKIRGVQPNSVKHRLIGKKDSKLTVYDAGSTLIKWMKHLSK